MFQNIIQKAEGWKHGNKISSGSKIRKLVEGRIRSSTNRASVLMFCYSQTDYTWRSVKLAIHVHKVQSLEVHGTIHSQPHKSPLHGDWLRRGTICLICDRRMIFEFYTTATTSIPVAVRSKAQVWGRSPAEIVGSNHAGGMDVYLLWGLCDELITRPEESYRL